MDQTFSYSRLYQFTNAVFTGMGCKAEDAATATKVLLSADLRGIDSHGIARLTGYVRLWEAKRINATPSIKIVHETPSTAVVDGDAGLGLVVAPFAMQVAIEKAKNVGTGWVSVRNSNHFGIAGCHAMMALPHDMIGMAMTNASALVAPTFSIERMLGTNPIAVAIPAGSQPPFVADFATTTAANGKLEILQRKNAATPVGWVQDNDGNESTDANELKHGGALLPLGSDREHGSHKGYALGSIAMGAPLPRICSYATKHAGLRPRPFLWGYAYRCLSPRRGIQTAHGQLDRTVQGCETRPWPRPGFNSRRPRAGNGNNKNAPWDSGCG